MGFFILLDSSMAGKSEINHIRNDKSLAVSGKNVYKVYLTYLLLLVIRHVSFLCVLLFAVHLLFMKY